MMNIYERMCDVRPSTMGYIDYTEKFSLNLYRWLRKQDRKKRPSPRVFVQIGNDMCQVGAQNFLHTQAPATYLGFVDRGDVFGSHLARIITVGASAESCCYPGYALPQNAVEITDEFWERYLRLGKCAIDPAHELYHDKDRYEVSGDTRICRWCGRTESSSVVPDTLEKTVWTPDRVAV